MRKDVTLLLYKSSAVHALSPVCHPVLCISKKGVMKLERVQKRTVKIAYDEQQMLYKEYRLRIFMLEGLSRREDMNKVCEIMKALD